VYAIEPLLYIIHGPLRKGFMKYVTYVGARGDAGRPRLLFPRVSLEIFIGIILPAALRPWILLRL
jgi:hypothetical protein